MTEDEAAHAIGRVPSDEPHARLMRCRGHQRLGHVDAVMANHDVIALLLEQSPHGEQREQRSLEIAPEHSVLSRAFLQLSARKEAERARKRRLAHGDAVEN